MTNVILMVLTLALGMRPLELARLVSQKLYVSYKFGNLFSTLYKLRTIGNSLHSPYRSLTIFFYLGDRKDIFEILSSTNLVQEEFSQQKLLSTQ